MRQTSHEAITNRVADGGEDNWDSNSRLFCCDGRWSSLHDDDIDLAPDELGSIQSSSRSRCTKAVTQSLADGVPAPRNPITGFGGCCAVAANGHAATPPPRSVMNSRRLIGTPSVRGSYPTTPLKSRVVHHSILAIRLPQRALRPRAIPRRWAARSGLPRRRINRGISPDWPSRLPSEHPQFSAAGS